MSELLKKACQEPTLVEALTLVAIWETDRVSRLRGEGPYDTMYKYLFSKVITHFKQRETNEPK